MLGLGFHDRRSFSDEITPEVNDLAKSIIISSKPQEINHNSKARFCNLNLDLYPGHGMVHRGPHLSQNQIPFNAEPTPINPAQSTIGFVS